MEETHTAWQDSLKVYRKAICQARKNYYSALIEENKNCHHFIEPYIPEALTCIDFMNFFNNKIILLRENILHFTDSPTLTFLHWLPVKFRVEFKILILTYNTIHGQRSS